MPLADMTPEVRRRVVDAWKDKEVTQRDLRERFRLSGRELAALRLELGPKAQLGPVSRWSINKCRKAAKLKALRSSGP